MDLNYIRLLIDHLDIAGVIFDRGLSDEEVERAESTYGFQFPPDLRKLVQRALPISDRFPNWRRGPIASIRRLLALPPEGLLFDVEHSEFWAPAWGERPADRMQALEEVRRRLENAPTLIPIYGHHYIPATPPLTGNPILSVVQSDIVYEGVDLVSYFAAEFGVPCPSWAASAPRAIPFWGDLAP